MRGCPWVGLKPAGMGSILYEEWLMEGVGCLDLNAREVAWHQMSGGSLFSWVGLGTNC